MREHITTDLKQLHWLKIQDRIIYKIVLLTYKSYYNVAPPYSCELINKKESRVNTLLGIDHHQLIMPPISKDCANPFLERSFIYTAPYEWNKLSKHIRTSNVDCFKKSVKTMLFTQQLGCSSSSSLSFYQTINFHSSVHCSHTSLNIIR